MVAGSAVQKFGANLDEHQRLAASDMLIEIYMAESTILRTEKLAKEESRRQRTVQCNAKLYLSSGRYRYSKEKKVLFLFCGGDEQRMMLMGLRRFTKYTNINIVGLREPLPRN
jgi:hypothetical protein